MPTHEQRTPIPTTTAERQAEYLAEKCRVAWQRYDADLAKLGALKSALKIALDPTVYRLVEALVDADGAASTSWSEATICELARHLPMIAPTLPMVWEHVADMNPRAQARCCVAEPEQVQP